MNRSYVKKSLPFFLQKAYVCIVLAMTATFTGCKPNVETPAVTRFTVVFSVDGINGTLEAKVDGNKINSGDQIEKGKTVIFTAVPSNSATHEVNIWTVSGGAFEPGTGENRSTTASLKVTDMAVVKVSFKQKDAPPPVQYKVTLEKTVGGNVEVIPKLPGSGMVNENTELTFTAHKLDGYKFVKWEEDEADTGVTESTYKLTVTQTVRVKAIFEEDGTPITKHTVMLTPPVNGIVTSVPEIPSDNQVAKGTEITFTAIADSGYAVETWMVSPNDALKMGGTKGSLTAMVTITADTTVNVTFKPSEAAPLPKHTVTFGVDGDYGTLSATLNGKPFTGGDVEQGKTVDFTAEPHPNYAVAGWTLDGTAVNGIAPTYSLTVNKSATVKVKFQPALTDQQKVEAAKEALQLHFQNGDTADSITAHHLSLPWKGLHATSIRWQSSNENIIKTHGGSITHPAEDTPVTLTATITKGTASTTKTFLVTVRGTNREVVIRAAKQAVRRIPPVVAKDTSSISLPNKETVSIYSPVEVEVDIEWKAEPDGVIAVPSGTVTPHETETKTVVLTATATKGITRASEEVTVTVYPKNNATAIKTVLDQIIKIIPDETGTDISLPLSPSGYKLTWSSSHDSILKVEGNSGCIKTWDLIDRSVTLTATLEDINTHETESQTKTVTIKARKTFGSHDSDRPTYEFDGDKLTLIDGDGQPAAVYRVHIDTDNKTITAALEQYAFNGTLMEPDAAAQAEIAENTEGLAIYFSIFALQQQNSVTLRDIRTIIGENFGFPPLTGTETDLIDLFDSWFKKPLSMTYDVFSKKTTEEQSDLLKKELKDIQSHFYKEYGLPETMPLAEAEAKMNALTTANMTARFNRAKKQHVYTYRIEGARLHTNAPYNSGLSWYQQRGVYRFHTETPADEIKEVRLSGEERYNHTLVNVMIRKEAHTFSFKGLNKGNDSYIAEEYGQNSTNKKVTVTVLSEDKTAHTLSVQISGDISFTGDLTFSGRSIPSHWYGF
jgi:hypothetical protein